MPNVLHIQKQKKATEKLMSLVAFKIKMIKVLMLTFIKYPLNYTNYFNQKNSAKEKGYLETFASGSLINKFNYVCRFS